MSQIMGAIIRFSDIGPHGLTNRHCDLLLRLAMWLCDGACNGRRRFLRDVWALFYGGSVQASRTLHMRTVGERYRDGGAGFQAGKSIVQRGLGIWLMRKSGG